MAGSMIAWQSRAALLATPLLALALYGAPKSQLRQPVAVWPDLGRKPFTISAWISTRSGGTIVARCPGEGPWAPQSKALFVRDGKLCLDVGWVGVVTSQSDVADGAPPPSRADGPQALHALDRRPPRRRGRAGVGARPARLPAPRGGGLPQLPRTHRPRRRGCRPAPLPHGAGCGRHCRVGSRAACIRRGDYTGCPPVCDRRRRSGDPPPAPPLLGTEGARPARLGRGDPAARHRRLRSIAAAGDRGAAIRGRRCLSCSSALEPAGLARGRRPARSGLAAPPLGTGCAPARGAGRPQPAARLPQAPGGQAQDLPVIALLHRLH